MTHSTVAQSNTRQIRASELMELKVVLLRGLVKKNTAKVKSKRRNAVCR